MEPPKEPGLAKSISFSTREERLKLSKLFTQPEPVKPVVEETPVESAPENKDEVKPNLEPQTDSAPIFAEPSVDPIHKPAPLNSVEESKSPVKDVPRGFIDLSPPPSEVNPMDDDFFRAKEEEVKVADEVPQDPSIVTSQMTKEELASLVDSRGKMMLLLQEIRNYSEALKNIGDKIQPPAMTKPKKKPKKKALVASIK